MKIRIAIAIPTYNRSETIVRAIKSLRNQMFTEFDVHVFDNCSTDNSLEVIKSLTDDRTFVHESTKNLGFVGNMNKCLALCEKYDWIGILHSDDYHIGESIHAFATSIKEFPEVGMVFSEVNLIGPNGEPLKLSAQKKDTLFKKGYSAINRSLENIPCSSSFYNSKVIKEIGFYDENFPFSADEEYNNRVAYKYNILSLGTPLANHVIHNDNLRLDTWLEPTFIDNYKSMRIKMLEKCNITENQLMKVLNKHLSLTSLTIASSLSKNKYQTQANRYNLLAWRYDLSTFLNPFNVLRSILVFFPNAQAQMKCIFHAAKAQLNNLNSNRKDKVV